MTREEMAKVLGMVSALDGQRVDEAKLEMWFRVLGEYRFEAVEASIVPAYKECKGIQLTAKELWQHVRRESSQPSQNTRVADMHGRGEHWECRPSECEVARAHMGLS